MIYTGHGPLSRPGQLATFTRTCDCYSMAHSADQLYSKHHGEVLRLHQLSKAELRAKRRAEWKQSQLTNSNGPSQANQRDNRQPGD